eukprot:7384775-Prymnesium_polylepis.3
MLRQRHHLLRLRFGDIHVLLHLLHFAVLPEGCLGQRSLRAARVRRHQPVRLLGGHIQLTDEHVNLLVHLGVMLVDRVLEHVLRIGARAVLSAATHGTLLLLLRGRTVGSGAGCHHGACWSRHRRRVGKIPERHHGLSVRPPLEPFSWLPLHLAEKAQRPLLEFDPLGPTLPHAARRA